MYSIYNCLSQVAEIRRSMFSGGLIRHPLIRHLVWLDMIGRRSNTSDRQWPLIVDDRTATDWWSTAGLWTSDRPFPAENNA